MGAGKFGIGILIMFAALVFFFFAFHPGGVMGPNGANVSNPGEALQFLISEFQKTAGVTATTDAKLTADDSSNAAYPGYTMTGSDPATSGNVIPV